jgi:hypothetical protein
VDGCAAEFGRSLFDHPSLRPLTLETLAPPSRFDNISSLSTGRHLPHDSGTFIRITWCNSNQCQRPRRPTPSRRSSRRVLTGHAPRGSADPLVRTREFASILRGWGRSALPFLRCSSEFWLSLGWRCWSQLPSSASPQGPCSLSGGSSPASHAVRFGDRRRARDPGAEFISIDQPGRRRSGRYCITKVGLVARYYSYRGSNFWSSCTASESPKSQARRYQERASRRSPSIREIPMLSRKAGSKLSPIRNAARPFPASAARS